MNQNRLWTPFALEAEHEDFGMTRIVKWHNALRDEVERLRADLAEARAQVVSGFYEDEVPVFRQGAPKHELESPVTADEVANYVQMIVSLRTDLAAAQASRGLLKQFPQISRGDQCR